MVLGGGAPDEPVYFDDVSLTSASVSGGANQISNPAFTNLTVAWTNYGGSGTGPLLTQTRVHSGTTSLLTAPTAYLGQTISGLIPNSSYTVSAFISGGTGTLTAGSAHTTATGTSGWTEINVTAASNSSGNLAITATNTGSSGNVYWDDFSINGSTYAGGQEFSYDGFGNLLSQQPVFGSAPMMTLAVNPTTNQVTSGGATYDAAGNLTYDGTTNYTFDEMNRMTQASGPYGTFGYSYSPGENKRMVVYGSSRNPQTLKMFLYAPNGKVLSQLAYQKNGSNWAPIAINALTNYLYLGGKALSYAESSVGSNASGTYWPYGSTNTNPTNGPSTFATYLGDWSTLYYADQRYYDYNWGRFLTADPSSAGERSANSQSWNRYSYTLGDPVNRVDSTGQFTTAEGCIDNPLVCLSQDGSGSIFGSPDFPAWDGGGMDPCEASAYGFGPFGPEQDNFPDCLQPWQSPPPQDQCSVSLYSRPVPFNHSPGNHTYLLVNDPDLNLDDAVLEGAPTGSPVLSSLIGFFGTDGQGQLKGSNIYSPINIQDATYDGILACPDVVSIDSAYQLYNGSANLARYNFLALYVPGLGQTYNSNSFTFSLLEDAGLSGLFGTPPGWTPGWGLTVPGLGPF
jgi:RHS repeat-associated protein